MKRVQQWTMKFVHEHHRELAIFWFLFGVLGVANSFVKPAGINITQSIPLLFFISVYANFVGHISALEANPDEDVVDNQKAGK